MAADPAISACRAMAGQQGEQVLADGIAHRAAGRGPANGPADAQVTAGLPTGPAGQDLPGLLLEQAALQGQWQVHRLPAANLVLEHVFLRRGQGRWRM